MAPPTDPQPSTVPDADAPDSVAAGAPEGTADALTRAHSELSELFDRVSDPDADRPAVLQTLVRRLASHASAENLHVVPALEAVDAKEVAARLGDDNHAAEKILVLIERRSATSPDLVELVNELLDGHRRHIEHYGADVEPLLRTEGPLAGDDDLAARVAAALADEDSHPHPLLPDHGPLGRVGRAVASAVDATRNRTVDR